MRLELEGGQWAELREKLDYARAREVRAAFLRINVDRTAAADLDLALVRAYVVEWRVEDLEGKPAPLEAPEIANDDAVQAISIAAIDLWRAGKVPKAGGESSPNTPPALPSP